MESENTVTYVLAASVFLLILFLNPYKGARRRVLYFKTQQAMVRDGVGMHAGSAGGSAALLATALCSAL